MVAYTQKIHDILTKKSNISSYEIQHYASIVDLPSKIKKALSKSEKNNFFHGYNWFDLLDKFSLAEYQEIKIYVILDIENKSPLMMYPLLISSQNSLVGKRRIISNLVTDYSIEFSPIFFQKDPNRDKLLTFFLKILKKENDWDILDFNLLYDRAIKDKNPLFEFLSACNKNFYLVNSYHHSSNWSVTIKNKKFSKYMRDRPSRLKNTLKRKFNKLVKNTEYKFIVCDNNTDINESLQSYMDIYQSSWKEDEHYPDFMPNLILKAAQLNILRLGIIYINDKPAAFVKMLIFNHKAIIYKLAYTPDFNAYSPGTILLEHMIRHVIEKDKVDTIDFGLGDDKYKKDWMDNKTDIRGVIIHNPSTLNGLFSALVHYSGRFFKNITRKSN